MNKSTFKILKEIMIERKLSEGELSRMSGVTQPTIHRMVSGETREPRRSNVKKIAAALGVTSEHLLGEYNGIGEPATDYNVTAGPSIKGRVPLISWVQAGEFCEAIDLFQPGDAEEWIDCAQSHSSEAFALRVQGGSMTPEFNEGEIVIIDPNASADSGRFIIAKKAADSSVTLKQLMIDGDESYLKALNPDWPNKIIKMNEEWHICGVVIAKSKSYL